MTNDSLFTQAEEGLHGKRNVAQKPMLAASLSSLLLPSVTSAAGCGALADLSVCHLSLPPALRAKQTKDGFLEKLKARKVVRGDLEQRDEDEDTWSPGTSSSGVRMYLVAQAAKKLDELQSKPTSLVHTVLYLQASVRG
jgi:hypothetical protein